MRRAHVGVMTALAAAVFPWCGATADGYEQWSITVVMVQDYTYGSDTAIFGVTPEATGMYEGHDSAHPPPGSWEHDLAWIFVADQGGDGGWNEFTGDFREYPTPGLLRDMRAPYGPGTAQSGVAKRTWAVQVHAPNGPGFVWDLGFYVNVSDGWHLPPYPFVVRILPNETFPDGLDVTSFGEGVYYIKGIPQWGPEPRIWVIEAGIVPEPALTWLAGVIPSALWAVRRRMRWHGT